MMGRGFAHSRPSVLWTGHPFQTLSVGSLPSEYVKWIHRTGASFLRHVRVTTHRIMMHFHVVLCRPSIHCKFRTCFGLAPPPPLPCLWIIQNNCSATLTSSGCLSAHTLCPDNTEECLQAHMEMLTHTHTHTPCQGKWDECGTEGAVTHCHRLTGHWSVAPPQVCEGSLCASPWSHRSFIPPPTKKHEWSAID